MTQTRFNPLEHPICLEYPEWLEQTAWAEHLPFAMFLVSAARPATLVELGTYGGVSYCAFCQAVAALKLDTRCFAVDTWAGDPHAGDIDESLLNKIKLHHDPRYGHFSTLLRSTFDDALEHFGDGTIDVLHIDGFHTYEAVKNDFERWMPKMSRRGVVMFHDTNVHRDDFGVWRLWGEVSGRYPSFEFLHGHGLGVLAVGEEVPDGLKFLFVADEAETHLIRKFFRELGACIETQRTFNQQSRDIEILRTYERAVNSSRVLRAYRVLTEEGVRSFVKKAGRPAGTKAPER
jgi:hypothetical protein